MCGTDDTLFSGLPIVRCVVGEIVDIGVELVVAIVCVPNSLDTVYGPGMVDTVYVTGFVDTA